MAYTLIAHTIAQSSGGGSVTTSAINTTGADLVIVVIGGYHGINPIGAVTDSKGNSYTGLTAAETSTPDVSVQIFYAASAVVGSGHTVSVGVSLTFCTIAVSAWSGGLASPFDVENGGNNGGGGVTVSPGSITPTVDNCLLINGVVLRNTTDVSSVDGGFTLLEHAATSGGNAQGAALSYLIQTTAASANPATTIVDINSSSAAAVIASFKPASGGGTTYPGYQSPYGWFLKGLKKLSSGLLVSPDCGGLIYEK